MIGSELTRRSMLAGATGLALAACTRLSPARADFAGIEASHGGRLGFARLDWESGRIIGTRLDERFAMCSAFKALLGGVVLLRAARGERALDHAFAIEQDDLVFFSPVVEQKVGSRMSVAELAKATIQTSDNAAANILLRDMGGPEGFTAILRGMGDAVTRLDRYEPMLNANQPGDPRDTSTPRAFAQTLGRFLFGDILAATDRTILQGWMEGAVTGLARLRAGIPDGWRAGDKTGTSERDQSNDVAFAVPPGRGKGPQILVSFLNIAEPMADTTNAIHARIARELLAASV